MVKHANEFRSWDKLKASLRSQIGPASQADFSQAADDPGIVKNGAFKP